MKAKVDGPSEEGQIRIWPDGFGFTGDSVGFPSGTEARDRPITLRFRDRSFLHTRAAGAFAMFVWSPAAGARQGVGIGDGLDTVRERYPEARCTTETIDDGPETVPSCLVTVGRIRLTFSKDPVEGLTLARR